MPAIERASQYQGAVFASAKLTTEKSEEPQSLALKS